MGDLVAARGVAISIQGLEVISDFNLDVRAGAAVGLVGESGSGKSVACRALTGTLGLIGGQVTRGELAVCRQDVGSTSERSWRGLRGKRVALVPQASLSGLDPLMRIGSQLLETIRVHEGRSQAPARAAELMSKVALPPALMRRYPHELSGGQRQRVMIALALAGRPELLVADEPTTALDVTIQREVLKLLAELCRAEDMGLILVSHDIGVIEQVCDEVVVMYGGCSIEAGAMGEVVSQPRHPYTRELLAARPRLGGGPLRGIDGMPPSPRSWPSGCRFAPRCRFATDECRSSRPELVAGPDGSSVACIRHQELDVVAVPR